MTLMRKPLYFKQARFSLLMVVFMIVVVYVSLESVVRRVDWPDRALIRDMRKIVAAPHDLHTYLSREVPAYGWDHDTDLRFPPEVGPSYGPPADTMLFMGDSITRGVGVAIDKEAYPVRLFTMLSAETNLQVINAAVQGFGIDQMILKLEAILPHYKPHVVIFAYIPHDLWRAGRNMYFGQPKPVLIPTGPDTWRFIPAPAALQYYRDFLNADQGFYRGVWGLRHLLENVRYYFPRIYAEHYRQLFRAIRNRLIVLAERYDLQVLIVRLASTWADKAVQTLDRIGGTTFAAPARSARYHFLDVEECARAEAETAGITYAKEFRAHPGPIGHQIYADCLVGTVRRTIRASKGHVAP
jgi:GDSL-like Lipase/Acylhydrolase family